MTFRRFLPGLLFLGLTPSGCLHHPGPTPFGLRRLRTDIGASFLVEESILAQTRNAAQGPRCVTRVAKLDMGGCYVDTLAVSGSDDIWFLDLRSRKMKLARSNVRNAALADIDRDGTFETVYLGGGFSDVGLLDASGVEVWKKSGDWSHSFTANGMTYADLDRDGKDEFYVAGKDGLYCFDAQGKERWKSGTGKYWHVAVYDPGDIEKTRIVSYSIDRREGRILEWRDARGSLIRRASAPEMSMRFEILEWPSGTDRLRIVARTGASVMLLDHRGRTLWNRPLARSLGMSGHVLSATLVRFHDSEPPYVAVLLATRAGWHRSLLCVLTLDGEIRYQEVLTKTSGLVAVRLPGSGWPGEALVVGGKDGQVFAYHAPQDR